MLIFTTRLVLVLFCLVAIFYVCTLFLAQNNKQVELSEGEQTHPVKAVTIEDVIAADIPRTVIERVSFPGFSYRDAFPDAADEPELVIKGFNQAPMLADLDSMPSKWREHYPLVLPPVNERLPLNPGVVRGPDGVGRYGGVWHRVRSNNFRWDTRIMYESLIRHDAVGRLEPSLAYRWEMEDNNHVFTFHLRPGHKWSDGTAFTSHDFVFSLMPAKTAPWPAEVRNWMQATDGANQIYLDDISDWHGLANIIVSQYQALEPSPGKQLFVVPGEFRPPPVIGANVDLEDVRKKYAQTRERVIVAQKQLLALLEQIARDQDKSQLDERARGRLIDLLSVVLKNRDYYLTQAWSDVDFKTELMQLSEIGASRLNNKQFRRFILLHERNDLIEHIETVRTLTDIRGTLIRANVLFFRAAYPQFIKPANKSRVKVEAVPDENGNDDHTLRFTFQNPSSFFLEKTTTFMFYFGLLNWPENFNRRIHPDGSRILNTIDICSWPKFIEQLGNARNNPRTPAGHVWNLLDENITARVETVLQQIHDGNRKLTELKQEDFKQAVVDAINKILARRDFYDPQIWQTIDFEKEYIQLTRLGLLKVFKKLDDTRRFHELLIRQDLLDRVHRDGIDSLSEQELFDFNLFTFRPVFHQRVDADGEYDDDGEYTVVAMNRNVALNHEANTGPKRYESWKRKRQLINHYYHPVHNRHRPTIKAWRVVSARKEQKQIAVRNPYYYRVDEMGNQLPYIDAIENFMEADREARILKLTAGAVDMQDTEIRLQDYTVLKQSEKSGNYEVRLWARDRCGQVAFFVNQNHTDPSYARVFQDKRFRQALSLALNRQEIIDVVFNGLGRPAQYSIPRGSPYYSEKLDKAFVEYDPVRAGQILDEMGLNHRSGDGTRMMRDENGKLVPLMIVISTDETRIPINVVAMACQYWRNVGINTQMKLQRELSRLASTGDLDIGVAEGGGSYFGPLLAGGFAPTHSAECDQWNQWVSYLRSGGIAGMEPPDYMKELDRMWQKVAASPNEEEKYRNWQALMDRSAQSIPLIGILDPPGELMYVKNTMKNVPQFALAGWIPHGPGNVCPEAFYFIEEQE